MLPIINNDIDLTSMPIETEPKDFRRRWQNTSKSIQDLDLLYENKYPEH